MYNTGSILDIHSFFAGKNALYYPDMILHGLAAMSAWFTIEIGVLPIFI